MYYENFIKLINEKYNTVKMLRDQKHEELGLNMDENYRESLSITFHILVQSQVYIDKFYYKSLFSLIFKHLVNNTK